MIAVGIDIGATNLKIVAVEHDGRIATERRVPTGDDWPTTVRIEVDKLQPDVIGIAAPGIAAADGRTISWMFGRMANLVNLDFAQHLNRRSVPVLNDAQAALLGESWLGAARGARNAVMLTVGSGVGGAILCDGRL